MSRKRKREEETSEVSEARDALQELAIPGVLVDIIAEYIDFPMDKQAKLLSLWQDTKFSDVIFNKDQKQVVGDLIVFLPDLLPTRHQILPDRSETDGKHDYFEPIATPHDVWMAWCIQRISSDPITQTLLCLQAESLFCFRHFASGPIPPRTALRTLFFWDPVPGVHRELGNCLEGEEPPASKRDDIFFYYVEWLFATTPKTQRSETWDAIFCFFADHSGLFWYARYWALAEMARWTRRTVLDLPKLLRDNGIIFNDKTFSQFWNRPKFERWTKFCAPLIQNSIFKIRGDHE